MFSELIESVAAKNRTNKGWGAFASTVFQGAGLAILLLIPLLRTQALPPALVGTFLVAPVPPAPAAPPPPRGAERAPAVRGRFLHRGVLSQPSYIPVHAAMIEESPLPPEEFAVVPGNETPGSLSSLDVAAEQRPAEPVAPTMLVSRVAIGGVIEAAKIINQPQPVYPVLAKQIHLQGNVVLHAIIGKDGRVSELQLISGHPLLVQAALDAVRRWRYSPTLLNREPVEVETTITVSFVLRQ